MAAQDAHHTLGPSHFCSVLTGYFIVTNHPCTFSLLCRLIPTVLLIPHPLFLSLKSPQGQEGKTEMQIGYLMI